MSGYQEYSITHLPVHSYAVEEHDMPRSCSGTTGTEYFVPRTAAVHVPRATAVHASGFLYGNEEVVRPGQNVFADHEESVYEPRHRLQEPKIITNESNRVISFVRHKTKRELNKNLCEVVAIRSSGVL